MRIDDSGCHLSYCTNIHPGESLAEVRAALASYVVEVKRKVCPNAPFGVGLRLSNAATEALADRAQLADLRAWLDASGLYVFTLNGFPYGAFHGTRVKAAVYEPDWRNPARLRYSNALADVLAALLPDNVPGSISSVPGAWKLALHSEAEIASMAEHMLQHATHLHKLRETSGKTLALALEPEPGCLLETIDESVAFFEAHLFSAHACRRFAANAGVSLGAAADALRRHLGICLDTCHAAVEFEDPVAIFAQLSAAGIDVKKLQLSAGLRVPRVDAHTIAALQAFAEDVYLHQTVERLDQQLTRYADLPDAIRAFQKEPQGEREWRVHFHVPIFLSRFLALESTQPFLRAVLAQQRRAPLSAHLEVETYTWNVLPKSLRSADVTDAIARELRFVFDELSGTIPA